MTINYLLFSETAISRITLSLFEDSGWYTVNYNAGLSNEEELLGSSKYHGKSYIASYCHVLWKLFTQMKDVILSQQVVTVHLTLWAAQHAVQRS